MPDYPNIQVFDNPEQLSVAAAERFVHVAQEAARSKRRFSVALAGGNTPRRVYELLASDAFEGRVEWSKVHLFFGDERCVPPDHPDSNYHMANEALISHIPIPPANVHRMVGEVEPCVSAALYETDLRQFFGNVTWPAFDLVFLGLGKDGHIASLFPHTKALNEERAWVAANWVDTLGVCRLTLTLPVLNHSHCIVLLVSGSGKAGILQDVLGRTGEPRQLPAQLINPCAGVHEWFVDKAAASQLKQ